MEGVISGARQLRAILPVGLTFPPCTITIQQTPFLSLDLSDGGSERGARETGLNLVLLLLLQLLLVDVLSYLGRLRRNGYVPKQSEESLLLLLLLVLVLLVCLGLSRCSGNSEGSLTPTRYLAGIQRHRASVSLRTLLLQGIGRVGSFTRSRV